MEKWTRDHPKEQILGNPNSSFLTLAQLIERNEVTNINHELCMFHFFISQIEPNTIKVALEHPD